MYIFIESLKLAALLLCVSGITCIINAVMKKRNFKVKGFVIYTIMGFISALLFILGGLSFWTVKGIVFAWIMLFASVQDISTREADDFLWVMLLILSLVNIGYENLISMLAGAVVVFIPQIVIAVLGRNGRIGGADIKISTAAAFMLGFWKGAVGYIIGLITAVVFTLICNKVKHRDSDKSFALMPFLSVGLMIGYII